MRRVCRAGVHCGQLVGVECGPAVRAAPNKEEPLRSRARKGRLSAGYT